MRKNKSMVGLRRSQLDRTLSKLKEVPQVRPEQGWIRTVREILGMTQMQLASRMSVTPPTLNRMEKAETSGSTTLKSLDRAASALNCKVVYFLVPESGSFTDLMDRQAKATARKAVELASANMNLEGQEVDDEVREMQIQQLADEFVRCADKRIWETSK